MLNAFRSDPYCYLKQPQSQSAKTSNGPAQKRENGNLSYPDLEWAFPIVKYTN
jgi:hypothetical protein